jgi:hypothetical protein
MGVCFIYPWKEDRSDNLKWQVGIVGIKADTSEVKLAQDRVY